MQGFWLTALALPRGVGEGPCQPLKPAQPVAEQPQAPLAASPPWQSLFFWGSQDGSCSCWPSWERAQLFHPNPLSAVPPDLCSVIPEMLVPAANETLQLALGSRVALNCTVRWASAERCEPVPAWTKDGQWLGHESSQDTTW